MILLSGQYDITIVMG